MATRDDSRRAMRRLASGTLLLACLTLAACEDRREPVKPKVLAMQSAMPGCKEASHAGAAGRYTVAFSRPFLTPCRLPRSA